MNTNLAPLSAQSVTKRDERPDISEFVPDTEFAPVELSAVNEVGPADFSAMCRVVAVFLTEGRSIADIADILKRTPDEINIIIKQPLTVDYIKQAGSEDIVQAADNLLRSSVIDTVLTLFSIRDNPKNNANVRIAACKEILDRVQGRPIPVTDVKRKRESLSSTDPLERARQLDEEIERLATQAQHMG